MYKICDLAFDIFYIINENFYLKKKKPCALANFIFQEDIKKHKETFLQDMDGDYI